MIVVSDTSPLNYLVLIQHAEVLPSLFGRVIAPPAVMIELQHPGAPTIVRACLTSPQHSRPSGKPRSESPIRFWTTSCYATPTDSANARAIRTAATSSSQSSEQQPALMLRYQLREGLPVLRRFHGHRDSPPTKSPLGRVHYR